MNVYGDFSEPQQAEGTWQENEEIYVEMSGALMDAFQKSDSFMDYRTRRKETSPMESKPRESSNVTEPYADIDIHARKIKERKEEAIKFSSKKGETLKTKLCATVFLALIVSVIFSIAASAATWMLFEYVIFNQQSMTNQSSSDILTKFNCRPRIVARCSLNFTDSNTFECVTEAVPIDRLQAIGIQCIQISTTKLIQPMITSLIIAEESNEAKCSCTVTNNHNTTSTLFCGIWVSNCTLNNS